jgi:WD40 repeat protein
MHCKPRRGRIHRALFPAFGITLAVMGAVFFRSDVRPKTATWQEGKVLLGHAGNVLAVAFSPDGRRLASGDQNGKIILWDLANGTARATLQHHEERILTVTFSPDGHILASGSSDGSIQLWNVEQGCPIRELVGHEYAVMGMVFTPDGRTIVSGCADGIVKLWDASTGLERACWRADERAGFSCLACSPDGALLATGSLHSTVKLWDLVSHQEQLTLPEQASVKAVSFADAGQKLIVANGQGSVTLWDRASQQPTKIHDGGENPLLSLATTADGRRVLAGSIDGTVNLWDLDVDRTPTTLEKDGMFIKAVAFSQDGSRIAFASNSDFSVRVWELVPNAPN